MTSATQMEAYVVDTNVLLVADGRHSDISSSCQEACIRCLCVIKERQRVVLDDGYRILSEYSNKIDANRGKGPGSVFLKWLLRHHGSNRCLLVPVHEAAAGQGFLNFPDDPALQQFDPADKKFVATAAACPLRPPILQAADAKWWHWAIALKRHGITVTFLCADDIQRFRNRQGLV